MAVVKDEANASAVSEEGVTWPGPNSMEFLSYRRENLNQYTLTFGGQYRETEDPLCPLGLQWHSAPWW